MGTPYPGVREQVQRHLVGPVLAALQAWDPVVGLVVGSYQGCNEGLHALAREVAEERARIPRRMPGCVFWRSWARVIRGRLPMAGRRPRMTRAHDRQNTHPGILRGMRAAAGL